MDGISFEIQEEEVVKIEVEDKQNLVVLQSKPSTSTNQNLTKEENKEEHPLLQWKKPTQSMFIVQQLIQKGLSPRSVLSILYPMYSVPSNIPDFWILQLLQELCENRTRNKLPQWNTFDDAVELIRRSKSIIILSGAGISVSCGIPDFRSEKGIYARLKDDFPELPDPHSMFDIDFFRQNPSPFYAFAKEIFPGQFRPSISHKFIKFLEDEGKLLRNYTQNIDTLERLAGINNVIECHGSFARSTCLNCKFEIDSEEIRQNVYQKEIAFCQKCKIGIIKPNITFFGEDLSEQFHNQMALDSTKVDLLIIIGSSLHVRPVSLIPYNIDNSIPQILINRELLPNYTADIKLLGDCDKILCLLGIALKGQIYDKIVKELESRPSNWNNLLLTYLQNNSDQTSLNKLNIEQFKQLFNEQPNNKKIKINNEVENEELKLWEGNYDIFVSKVGKKQKNKANDDYEELVNSLEETSSSSNNSLQKGEDDGRGCSLPCNDFNTSINFDQRKSSSCPPEEIKKEEFN
ncbi:Deacetylase sirtuin-type domain-containing protein [Meloidogyne graminicola]|uniref:NAD-dependent protein deacetylase sir-2.1 n=1 Tax=Meloidogyne graminicola TaxID=189291 RepID=A0A8S9ZD07_9BILA|nr:Deacetylase sirtuin-type domain-containing protein [Meloidogyne graminicola]